MLKKLSERCRAQVVWIEADGSGGGAFEESVDANMFTSSEPASSTARSPPKETSTEDKELEMALAASRSHASEATDHEKAIAAAEARELEEAIKASESLSKEK